MSFAHLDQQLNAVRASTDVPDFADDVWGSLATTVHAEVAALGDAVHNQLRLQLLIPPERYIDELTAFQAWMEVARANATNPVIVRAQVMTEIYVAFVWLRDSLMKPVAARAPEDSVVRSVHRFLSTGRRRLLRNAIAHGHWCYLSDSKGLEYWAEPSRAERHQRFAISQADLDAWQLLARGTAIATLLAVADDH
ncbi:MAG: hypothetical protein M0T77_13145 [Actinomycetota bacterium]|nr:hypothetical protein [Actinomycetota bacterium]